MFAAVAVSLLFCAIANGTAAWAQQLTWPPTTGEVADPTLRSELRFLTLPEPRGTFIATYGPYTHHRGKGNYNSRPAYRSLEWETADRWTIGGAAFQNSFSQPCWYAFTGKHFKMKHRSGRFFAKVTGGIIYGYKPPHAYAVPLNWGGFTPAIIPSLGYQYKNVNFQFVVFGLGYGALPTLGFALR